MNWKKKNRCLDRRNSGQLLLLAGITISLAIIGLSMIAANLAEVNVYISKSSYVKSDYDNIRKEFGVALKDRLSGRIWLGEDFVDFAYVYFNDTRDVFTFFVETLKGNCFNAEFLGLEYNIEQWPDGVIVRLMFSNGYEHISETIVYDI